MHGDAIADHLGVSEGEDREIDELKKDVAPMALLDEIDYREGKRPSK